MKRAIIIGTLIGALAVGGAALAHPPGGGGMGGGGGFFGGRFGRLLEGLNLTEQQQEKADDIRFDIRKRAKAMKKDAGSNLSAIQAELAKPKPDAAKLHALADQKIEEMRKLAHYSIDQMLTLHATLSAEQRQQLVEKMQKAEKRMKRWQEEQ